MSRLQTPKAKSTLSMLSRTETRKKERGSRTKTRKVMYDKAAKSQTFVDLCNTDIMNTSLEFVEHKSWLSKGNVNIFIIGEVHSHRNYRETGIFEMFEQLVEKIKARDTSVDIMLEISEGNTNRDEEIYMRTPENLPRADFMQLQNVRNLFRRCVGKHNCGKIRVHWVDNVDFSIESTYKTSTKFKLPGFAHEPSVRIALDAMPQWLITFYDDYERYDKRFQAKFEKNEDLLQLLHDNTIVLKEIDKAAHVQRIKQETPIFDRIFATNMLKNLIKSYSHVDYSYKRNIIFDTARVVMDIYTVARIIKSNMKNVIIYVGGFHADNVVYMLTELGYTMNKIKRLDVDLPMRTPLPVPTDSDD